MTSVTMDFDWLLLLPTPVSFFRRPLAASSHGLFFASGPELVTPSNAKAGHPCTRVSSQFLSTAITVASATSILRPHYLEPFALDTAIVVALKHPVVLPQL